MKLHIPFGLKLSGLLGSSRLSGLSGLSELSGPFNRLFPLPELRQHSGPHAKQQTEHQTGVRAHHVALAVEITHKDIPSQAPREVYVYTDTYR